jgi:sulfatase maturation enzyme AslB (radical SAM superfamily)
MIDRETLYRFPWSKTDNPGGWIEVTDICDLQCPGCYRHKLEGHQSLEKVKKEIIETIKLTNCDYITIAGGEPLEYPYILEVVSFISSLKIKPAIFTNGLLLNEVLANELKKAGLAKIHFHIDSAQNRKGWEGKSEEELNVLRQFYADLLWKVGKIQCGFHVTIFRSNLNSIPVIVKWCLENVKKVNHISFIAYRTLVKNPDQLFIANGKKIDLDIFDISLTDHNEISITSEEMYDLMINQFPHLKASAYLNGTAIHETNKFLITANIGSNNRQYGVLGSKSMELTQMFYHLFNRRYYAFLKSSRVGKKIFLLSLFDLQVRQAFYKFLKASFKNPSRLFDKIYVQSIHFQQPNEVIGDAVNLCDDCVNMMVYNGRLINSCRLDEYRMLGGPINIVKITEK